MTTEIYPPGPITPYGEDVLQEGAIPNITCINEERTRVYYLMGGLSPQAPGILGQDGLHLREHPVGLEPPLKHLDSAGARDDGVVHGATLFDPMEIELPLLAVAHDARGLSRVVSAWHGSWRRNKLVRIEWITPDGGLWWVNARKHRASRDRAQLTPRLLLEQRIDHVARADFPFWASVDSLSSFRFTYADGADTFAGASANDLGTDWEQDYNLAGAGVCGRDGAGNAVWKQSGITNREVVNRYKPAPTTTDNQIVEVKLGGFFQFPFPALAYFDVWLRMGVTAGAWNGSGVRFRVGPSLVTVTRHGVGDAVGTTMFTAWNGLANPYRGETWRFAAGVDGDTRRYKVWRDSLELMNRSETGTGSLLGTNNRHTGFGMHAGTGLFDQIDPPGIDTFFMGDNTNMTQSGFCPLTNIGTEDGYPRFKVRGPGLFHFGNGPDAQQFIEFGPLVAGQEVLITTRPRLRTVVDITPNPLPGQVLTPPQQLIQTLINISTNNNVPPLLEWYQSMFGINPPQDPLYSLLKGRFTRPIPGVEQPRDAVTRKIAVKIVDGNANSAVIAALTPLRTWPE